MKKINFILLIISFIVLLQADNNITVNSEDDYIKQKEELLSLKEEINNFYSAKEEEYLKQKSELEALKQSIDNDKKEIKALKEANEKVLKEIQNKVATKTTKIYNKMKPKIAGKIFNKMIRDGKEQVVFDIIMKLKDNQVTNIMKYINVEYASMLTEKLDTFKKQIKNKKGE